MKKILLFSIFFTLFIGVWFSLPSVIRPASAVSMGPDPTAVPPNCEPFPTNSTPLGSGNGTNQLNATEGQWECDPEVTFTAKMASRAKDTVNWLLGNYRWATFKNDAQPGKGTPFDTIWNYMIFVAYTLLLLMVIVAALLLIVTRGRSITVKRFIIRFILAGVFIWFSFSIVKTVYDLTDILQAMFINLPRTQEQKDRNVPDNIYTGDLLNVAWDYKTVKGLRKWGIQNDEAAITSLILIKATAATYYTMFIILIIRKIIMWFFILVSPLFPLLLFFKPIRNTAKLWIGEFFRWVLYAPLFIIFLRGLVEMWKFGGQGETGIPLAFDLTLAANAPKEALMYPTSINLIISGPSKIPLVDGTNINNVNFIDSYVLYLIALIMLWVVIIMPWLLLKIFLDMCCNQGLGTSLMSALARRTPFFGGGPPVGPSGGSPPSGSAGLAKTLPMTRFKHTPVAEIQQSLQEAEAQTMAQTQNQQTSAVTQAFSQTAANIANMAATQASSMSSTSFSQNAGQLTSNANLKLGDIQAGQITAELLQATNLTIPTMTDIAKYEAAMMSQNKNTQVGQEASRINEMIAKLSGTSKIASPAETQKFTAVRERVIKESSVGNPIAKSMASSIKPISGASIPDTNEVQQVNLDDYEEVKKTWVENYRNLEVPLGADGQPQTREVWLKQETQQIPGVIDKLQAQDADTQKQGMQQVSKILPFLLLGGFSKAEIISYLKAKHEAAKQVQAEVAQTEKSQEDEDTKVGRSTHGHAQKTMAAEVEENKSNQESSGIGGTLEDEEDSPLQSISTQQGGGLISGVSGEAKAVVQEFINQLSAPSLKATDEQAKQVSAELINVTNVPIPNMKAIARIDASSHSSSQELKQEISKLQSRLQRLEKVANIDDRKQPQNGEEQGLKEIKGRLLREAQSGNEVAKSMLNATKPHQTVLPESNAVQTVNLDDYEDVKKTWVLNFRTGEPPVNSTGQPMTRTNWLKDEIQQIPEAIDLLLSNEQSKLEQGKKRVSKILPFLLLGGFSKAEIISYLKAKLEAAKQAQNELMQIESKPDEVPQNIETAAVIRHLEEPLPGADPNNHPQKPPTDGDTKKDDVVV